jgi:transposase
VRARMLNLHWTATRHLRLQIKAFEQSGEYRTAKRMHAIILNSSGKSSGEIADVLECPRSCVTKWLMLYETHGFESFLEGHRTGRPRLLTEQQLITLHDIVDSGPVAYGYLGGVWTSQMLASVIFEEFHVSYHPGHVRKILDKIDLSMQRPRKILTRADPQKREKWRRYTFPLIKKKSKKKAPR